ATNATQLIEGAGNGAFTFGNRKPVVYNSIELLNPTGATVAVTLDLSLFPPGTPSLASAGLNNAGTDFVVTVSNNGVNPMTALTETAASIQSFTVKGSSNPEAFDLVESSAGLPPTTVTNVNTVTVVGSAAADNFVVTSTQVADAHSQMLNYSGVQTLAVHGGN